MKKLIYFDSAATSWPKPECVIKAVKDSFYNAGGNPGRSSHMLSVEAAKRIYSCRETLCRIFNTNEPEKVVLTYNATLALNMAIKGLAKKDSRILISNLEHNSVIRPVYALCQKRENRMEYSVFDALGDKDKVLGEFESKLTPDTSLAVVTMASNVCGRILPVKEISEICKKRKVKLIVDCAQSAGGIPVDFNQIGADAICGAGHKSLYGPQGVGFCILSENTEPQSIIEGGNGVNSLSPYMDAPVPERLEAGTPGTPAICGLDAGAKYVMNIGIGEIYERGKYLGNYLSERLMNIKDVEVYGDCDERTPCILFNKRGIDSERAANLLAQNGICVRGGLHCAPLAHEAFGTAAHGAVRVSMSFGNKTSEIDALLKQVDLMRPE